MDELLIEKRKRRHQRWRRFFAVAAILLVALGVWSLDEPPPDVSDLLPTLRQLPDDQNAYAVLAKAAGLVKWKYYGEDDFSDVRYTMIKGEKWDQAKASAWLASTDEIWPLLERAAALPAGQAPTPKLDYAILGIRDIGDLLRLSMIRAWSLYYAGKPDAGMDALLTGLNAAHKLEESRGGVATLNEGGGLCYDFEASLIAMAAQKEPSATILRRALAVLAQTRPNPGEMAQNLGVDYQTAARIIEAAGQGNSAAVFQGDPYQPAIFKFGINWPLLFKPHRIQRVLAENYRRTLKALHPNAENTGPWSYLDERQVMAGPGGWRSFNPDNYLGRAFLRFGSIGDGEPHALGAGPRLFFGASTTVLSIYQ